MNVYKGALVVLLTALHGSNAFNIGPTSATNIRRNPFKTCATQIDDDVPITKTTGELEIEAKRQLQKEALLGLIGSKKSSTGLVKDPVLACPLTKEALSITLAGPILAGTSASGVRVVLKSSDTTYIGRTDAYFNLLQREEEEEEEIEDVANETVEATTETKEDESNTSNGGISNAIKNLSPFIPPQLRGVISSSGLLPDSDYIPMRDLFTSPSVSFAYERGWRQGFAAAGFPGPDKEYEMVRDYFMTINPETVVDMSCATGLFTRRLAKSNDYKRVIACDYSEAMLLEARNRINADPDLNKNVGSKTRLDLVRCDVANIPMQSESIDALHAGAAMHCWPELDAALSEIHRVLKPGGRYFATTFLATYFNGVRAVGGENSVQEQAFQYFDSVDVLEELLIKGGFNKDKINIKVIGQACVVIRAEK